MANNSTYTLTGGTINIAFYPTFIDGTFTQKGGTVGIWGPLYADNGGTYSLQGGTLTGSSSDGTVRPAAYEYVGYSGSGTFTQKGGSNTVTKLVIAAQPGSSGVYDYSGGTLNAGSIEVNSGGVFKAGKGVNVQVSGTLAVGPAEAASTGYLTGAKNSVFTVGGDFISHSIASKVWNTANSDLVFLPGAEHLLSVCGIDFGRTLAGYEDNFAWDTLDFTGSPMLHLVDGNTDPGGALYVRSLLGVTLSGNLVTDIEGNGLNIYYDPDLIENAYLNHHTFDLIGGGHLSPYHTPVPPTVWLLGSGLLGLIGWRRFRKA
jgi:hypothetical protein